MKYENEAITAALIGITIVLAVGLGVFGGAKVTAANKNLEIIRLEEQVGATLRLQAKTAGQLRQTKARLRQNQILVHVWTGMASWYGPGFHGKPTASGQLFDMNDLTAASNTIPLGSMVVVENPENGRMVPVFLNDFGPDRKLKRGLDLSKAAAERLGFLNKGHTKVKVYRLVKGHRKEI